MRNSIITLLFLILFSCKEEAVDPWKSFTTFVATYNTYQLEKSDKFVSDISKGTINNIDELSGLAESNVNANTLWGHNDSGNPTTIFLIDEETASTKASYHLSGIVNEDWEDIAVGPGPKKGFSYIYLGDIGDNHAERIQRTIYRFPEPLYSDAHAGKIVEFTPIVERIDFKYPDGPHNAETLLLDPSTLDLYVVTKYGTNSLLFVAKYPQSIDHSTTLTLVGTFPFREATGGSVSADGKQVLIKTYDQIFYWNQDSAQPLWKLLSKTPQLAPYDNQELKGESVAWSNNSKGYYTASEKSNSKIVPLYYYKVK